MSNWSQHDISIDGIQIHYTRTGDGSKPPVVLIHGFSDDGMCWLPVARDLEADYDLILPDARGHGRSARVHPGESIDMVADIAGLIRALGLQRPVVGGHSMGGSVSAALGARFPELAGALVLEDPGWHKPLPATEAASRPQANPFVEFLKNAARQETAEIVSNCRAENPLWQEAELLPWAESKQRFDLTIFETSSATRSDYREVVRAIRCPTLLITADVQKGAIVSPEMSAEVCELNPLLRAVNVPAAGHSIRRENYAAFLQALRAFLAQNARPS